MAQKIPGNHSKQMGKTSSKKKHPDDWDEGEEPVLKRIKELPSESASKSALEYDRKFWGPYLSDRQWGTVREDKTAVGDSCWNDFSHDAARSSVYQSGEDGLMGVSDKEARFCASLALWNHKDPFLKERLFGLAGPEGNHGEDVKELYYYLDNTPDHTYMKSLYRYPIEEFPYEQLRTENEKREVTEKELEIIDTGVFDNNKFWDVYTEYAKDTNGSIVCQYTVHNRSHDPAPLAVIPQFWFRNTWSGLFPDSKASQLPQLSQVSEYQLEAVYSLGTFIVRLGIDDAELPPEIVFTDNEDSSTSPPSKRGRNQYYKDAFHKYIVDGIKEVVKKDEPGTKCAAVYNLRVPPGGYKTVFWGLYPKEQCISCSPWDVSDTVKEIINHRSFEADSFYHSLFPVSWDREWLVVARQACAGLLWHKQYYKYNVAEWTDAVCKNSKGQGSQKGCCGIFRKRDRSSIRNNQWMQFDAHDIMSLPDKWEFPWFAPWDTAFQMIPFARLDPEFAKGQLLLLLSDRYLHPKGQIPGCEYNFDDMNPPIQAWSALKVYQLDGSKDKDFLVQAYTRSSKHYQWMLKEKSLWNTFVFQAGFLGLDNISAINRSEPTPADTELEQADATGWMAVYSLNMMEMAMKIGNVDSAIQYLHKFVKISEALNLNIENGGLWHNEDRFYYDVLSTKNQRLPIRLRSLVGLVPILGCCLIGQLDNDADKPFYSCLDQLCQEHSSHIWKLKDGRYALSTVPHTRLQQILTYLMDKKEFLSPFGIRSLSKYYREKPYTFQSGDSAVSYAPGESDCKMFGGNSNWRGPIWLCMNYILMEALETHHNMSEERLTISVNSGQTLHLQAVALEICRRITSLFLPQDGQRPLHGDVTRYKTDPLWQDLVLFYEYFHSDTGRGCGASHQTGWTSLVVEFFYKILEN